MEITNKLKKRFISDIGSNIHINIDPYFTYLLNLYKEKDKYAQFSKMISNSFKTDSEYLDFNDRINYSIIKKISESDQFKCFNSIDMKQFNINSKLYSKKELYSVENLNKSFISIDLKHANFQSLKYVDSVLGFNTYDELFKSFFNNDTPIELIEYITNSKQNRQVIFGNLNPSRQQSIQKYLLSLIILKLIEYDLSLLENIHYQSSDEIYFCTDEFNYSELMRIFEITKLISNELNLEVKIEAFKLLKLDVKKLNDVFYLKFCTVSDIKVKGLPSYFYPQYYKKYICNSQIENNDLIFEHNHLIAKFEEPIF